MLTKQFCAVAMVVVMGASVAEAGNRASARLLGKGRAVPATEASLVKGGDCCVPPPVCSIYKPCVTYKGCIDSCSPKVSQVLVVPNPRDCCCAAEVPVCLPACCANPCVSSRCLMFGRSKVTYEYDCGVCVTVVFRKCGDVVVKYHG